MALSMFEIGIIILLIMGVSVMIVQFILSRSFQKKLTDKVVVKGMNGLAGSTIKLTCPPEMVISFTNPNSVLTRGAVVALGDPTCDAFAQTAGQTTSFFNPATTIDVFETNSLFPQVDACKGKNTCSFVVPDWQSTQIPTTGNGSCLRKTGQKLAFIGTYDCIGKQ
jgi:hypothetical protein